MDSPQLSCCSSCHVLSTTELSSCINEDESYCKRDCDECGEEGELEEGVPDLLGTHSSSCELFNFFPSNKSEEDEWHEGNSDPEYRDPYQEGDGHREEREEECSCNEDDCQFSENEEENSDERIIYSIRRRNLEERGKAGMIDNESLKNGIVGGNLSEVVDCSDLIANEEHTAVPAVSSGFGCFVIRRRKISTGEFCLFLITEKELEIVNHLIVLQLSISADFGIGHDEAGDLVDGRREDMREVKDRKTGKPGEVDKDDRENKSGNLFLNESTPLVCAHDEVDSSDNEDNGENHIHEIPRETPEIVEELHKCTTPRAIEIEDNGGIEEVIEKHEDKPCHPSEEGQNKSKKTRESSLKVSHGINCLSVGSLHSYDSINSIENGEA